MLLLRLALFSFAVFFNAAFAEPVPSGAGRFAISFFAENWQQCPQTGSLRCVLGKLSSNYAITLLSSETSATCRARTSKNFDSKWESGNFSLTYVDTTACPGFAFRFAVKNDPQHVYRLPNINSLPAPSAKIAREIENKIRSEASRFQPSSAEHAIALASGSPLIFRLPSMNKDSFVVAFENSATPGDQVHFLYAPEGIKLIHSAASMTSVFSLGDEYFISYSFTCRIGCGYSGSLVAKLSKNTYRLVMFDSSTSS